MKLKELLKDMFTDHGEMDKFPTPFVFAVAILATAALVGADHKNEWHLLSTGDICRITLVGILEVGGWCILLSLLWGGIGHWWKERSTTSFLLALYVILVGIYILLGL